MGTIEKEALEEMNKNSNQNRVIKPQEIQENEVKASSETKQDNSAVKSMVAKRDKVESEVTEKPAANLKKEKETDQAKIKKVEEEEKVEKVKEKKKETKKKDKDKDKKKDKKKVKVKAKRKEKKSNSKKKEKSKNKKKK